MAIFNQVNVVVADMAASIAFYRRLGLDLPEGAETEAGDEPGDHIEVRSAAPGGATFELDAPASAARWRPGGGSSVVLGLSLPTREAVDAAHDDAVAAGADSRVAPHDAFWGSRYAVVVDPDGNDVGLMSPRDPERASAPPS